VLPHVLMLVKPDLQLLNLIAKIEFTISKENKDISVMLELLDFTNVFEMLIAQAMLLHDLNSFHVLKELNADAETPSKNAHQWVQLPLALTHLTINHTPLEPPPEQPEPLDMLLIQLTNPHINKIFAEITDGIALTFLKDILLIFVLILLVETLEMVVFVLGMLIPTLDLVLEILIVLDLDNVQFHLTAETSMPMPVSSTHVVVSEEFAPQFAHHKLYLPLPNDCLNQLVIIEIK